ncbi:unnamed protein product, partial [Ectocarpus fasciculatus]
RNSGSPTEARTYRDIEAVCAWARKNVLQEGEDGSGKNKGHGLILYGQSVGSGPTCYLASDKSKGPFAGALGARQGDIRGRPRAVEEASLVGAG